MPAPAPVAPQYSTPTIQQPPQGDMALPQMIMGFLSNLVVANQAQAQAKPAPTAPTPTVDQNQLLSLLTQLASQTQGSNSFHQGTQ
eukprot:Nitzschia sp. Nitz4//scaffold72_size95085//45807//46064//NITZ4_004759-RA/size95085-processed-gene-0.25-mRNA-1//-1//CDS//3329557372//5516//frame0